MRYNISRTLFVFILLCCALILTTACDGYSAPPKSSSGVSQTRTTVKTESNGNTVEQNNVVRRLQLENSPGSIKHLYVISAYSGQVIIYSTVKGKVTSSSKRLSPYGVNRVYQNTSGEYLPGVPVNVGGRTGYTGEVLQDDGTYGSSIEYLFWFDVNDRYHQHYVSGGQILHVSDHPINVPNIIINFEDVSSSSDR